MKLPFGRLRPRPQVRSEAGETLVEMLIAAALMGIVVVGIIGGLASTVLGVHVHREQADANTLLVSASEHIKTSDFDFANVDCSQTAPNRTTNYENRAREVSIPAGWATSVLTVDSIAYETITSPGGTPTVSFGPTCTAGLSRQLVTLKVTTPDSRVSPTLSFVKGDD